MKDFFYYNSRELRGVLVLISCLIVFLVFSYFYEKGEGQTAVNTALFEQKIDSITMAMESEKPTIKFVKFNPNTADSNTLLLLGFSERQIRTLQKYRKAGGRFYKKEDFAKLYFVDDSLYARYEAYIHIPTKRKKESYTRKNEPKISVKKEEKTPEKAFLFEFNPNTLSKNGWDSLGVPQRTISIIQNYRNKGGKFYKKEDLLKIYGFPRELYETLAPHIVIPEKKMTVVKTVVHNLNTITADELEDLKISKSTALKLIGYRESLGGFVHFKQLLEIYNLKERDYNLLKKYGKVAGEVIKININTATAKDLYSHPYITSSIARDIVRYRKRKGNYTDLEILSEKKIIPKKSFEKIKPYLTIL